jgi:hypothetical protein
MQFGEVLSRAWKIIWRFKVLWIFGILASCGSGGGGSGGGNNGFPNNGGNWDGPNLPPGWEANLVPIIIAVVIGILLLSIIVVVISTVGRVGLIRGASRADEGETHLAFSELWTDSLPYFWRVVGLNLLVFLLSLVAILLVGLPLVLGALATVAGANSSDVPVGLLAGLPLFFCLLCLFIPISWVVNLVVEQAVIAIVTENLGIMDGVRRGWAVVRRNLGNVIVMAIILYGGRWVVSLILSIPVIAALVPVGLAFFMGAQNGEVPTAAIGMIIALMCVLVPLFIVVNGILQAYISTAWTLTFRRLTGKLSGDAAAIVPVASEPAA